MGECGLRLFFGGVISESVGDDFGGDFKGGRNGGGTGHIRDDWFAG